MWLTLGRWCREVLCTANPLIGRGFSSGCKAEQGLERGHRLPPPIVAKYEFVEINLELIAAHTVMGSIQSSIVMWYEANAGGALSNRESLLRHNQRARTPSTA